MTLQGMILLKHLFAVNHSRIIPGVAGLLCCLILSCTAYAEDLTLKLNAEQSIIQGKTFTISVDATAFDQSRNVAGAAFTVLFDSAILTFDNATSLFFPTFASQSINPSSVVLDGVTYVQPLVVNNQTSGKVMITAASAIAQPIPANSKATLFQLQFSVKANAAIGSSNIILQESTIKNTVAGYPVQGEIVPVLTGATGIGIYPTYTVALAGSPINIVASGPNPDDLDGDGLSNADEKNYGTDPLKADTDGDGLLDNAEIKIYLTNPLKVDTDGDGVPDGYEIKAGTSPTDAADTPPIALETGTLSITSDWQDVTYTGGATYSMPVVVAKPASSNEADSVIVQIKDVTSTGFKIRLKETNTLTGPGGVHGAESIGYIVMEAGTFNCNGAQVTAGVISAQQAKAGLFKVFNFPLASKAVPVVVASVTTSNEEEMPVNVRLNSVTMTGFSYLLQEEEKADQIHGQESVSYIAWEPSVTLVDDFVVEVGNKGTVVGNAPYSFSFTHPKNNIPVLLADMQTAKNLDPASLRYSTLSSTGATVYVSEDISKDAEISHSKETLGYIAISTQPPISLETGTLSVTSEWQNVSYANGITYKNPVVVSKPASSNETDSVIVQIKNVTSTGFKIRLKETNTLTGPGGTHGAESIGYIVMEAGTFNCNGAQVTAGVTSAQLVKGGKLQAFKFPVTSKAIPVVVASVTTANEEEIPVNVRLAGVTMTGFSFKLQEEEKADQIHGQESVSYIAWEPSVTLMDDVAIEVGSKDLAISNVPYSFAFAQAKSSIPVLLADMQTINDLDPSSLRYSALSTAGATIYVSEDNSKDAEAVHAKETLGYILLSPAK